MDHPRPEFEDVAILDNTEAQLRAEIEILKRQLEEQKRHAQHAPAGHASERARPSKTVLWTLALGFALLVAAGFLAGYIPHQRRESMLIAEAKAEGDAAPLVNVVTAERSGRQTELILPGNIQPVTEAPVLARASGYVKRRYVDIGDRVKAGQLVAEIEAPELDQQVRQARAALEQSQASLEQSVASLQQGKSNEELARVTAQRWDNLVKRGVVSRQENDTYQAQYESQKANVHALEKAVAAAKSNVAVSEASLARLGELQGYEKVLAPFAGVITLRNVDVGMLITDGSTLLFRIAQTDKLRTYVNVPQSDASSIRVGQAAKLSIADLPNRKFDGVVTRTANSLDPASRTLLTEVQTSNPDGSLMPGMYADVDLTTPRKDPPVLIPGDTLVVRTDGPQVATVDRDKRVHYQLIQLGRDYGDRIEVLSGLEPGQQIIVNPGDAVREKAKVNPVPLHERAAPAAAPKRSS
jgi:RND family efflux transporter MFP subunit